MFTKVFKRYVFIMGTQKLGIQSRDKEQKLKDKKYLKWVASNPCILCQSVPVQAHHITYAQHRGFGQKVGDQWVIPLCFLHHDYLHRCGMSERDFWGKIEIDPLDIATTFYKHHTEMWKNPDFFYDDSMLWVMVYNKLVPKIKKHIDFIMQPKLKNIVSSPEV